MKKFGLYVILAYFALSVQSLFFNSGKPDLVLVLVCFYSLRHNLFKGVVYGAFTGLVIDASSGFIVGPNIISKSVAAFLMRTVKGNVLQWNIYISTITIALLSVIDILIVYGCLNIFSDISLSNRPWDLLWYGSIYTIISAVILYSAFKPEKDELAVAE